MVIVSVVWNVIVVIGSDTIVCDVIVVASSSSDVKISGITVVVECIDDVDIVVIVTGDGSVVVGSDFLGA